VLRGLDAGDRHRFISALRDLAEATGDQGGNLAVAFRDIEILKINGNRLSDGIKSRVRGLLLGPGRYTAGGGKKKRSILR